MKALEDEILHAKVYDPVKAHEYYMRTRHLKGRRRSSGDVNGSSRPGDQGDQGGTGGRSNAGQESSNNKSREAQIEELRGKVDRLRELLRIRVDAAKERAGVEEPKESSSSSSSTSKKESSTEKDSSSTDSKDKPLTEQQKNEKNKAAREKYEKETKSSPAAREIEALQNVVKNLQERLARLPKSPPKAQFQPNGTIGR